MLIHLFLICFPFIISKTDNFNHKVIVNFPIDLIQTSDTFLFGDHYTYGIAYKNEIICGCCGGVFEISEIVEHTPIELQSIYPYENWADLTEEIFGGEYPAGYEPQDKED